MKASGIKATSRTASRLKRLEHLCESLPDAVSSPLGRRGEHRSFLVRKKIFGYYLFDHHGDGRVALWCKAGRGHAAGSVCASIEAPWTGPASRIWFATPTG